MKHDKNPNRSAIAAAKYILAIVAPGLLMAACPPPYNYPDPIFHCWGGVRCELQTWGITPRGDCNAPLSTNLECIEEPVTNYSMHYYQWVSCTTDASCPGSDYAWVGDGSPFEDTIAYNNDTDCNSSY